MSNPVASYRALLVYAICLPLAVFLGYSLAGPLDSQSFFLIASLLFFLLLPVLFRWHHTWLIVSWNLSMVLYGLPGLPPAWYLMAFVSFFIALGHHILNRNRKYLQANSVTWALILLAAVVLATAQLTGGIGLKIFGSSAYGGKRYIQIALAVLGYFAFISEPIPPEKRNFYVTLFFLSGVTQMIGDLFSFVTPNLYFIFLVFPANFHGYMSMADEIPRFGGIAGGSSAIIYALFARYGVAGILATRKLWRPALFFTCIALTTLGGFRSMLLILVLLFVVLFFMEGLTRSPLLPLMMIIVLLAGIGGISFADRLPLNIQRSLAFLPIRLDPVARMSAETSSNWRVAIWQDMLPQVPKYLVLGKGLSFSGAEMEDISNVGGGINRTEGVEMAGDYHSGPLSLIIPFGLFGTIAFFWFLLSSLRVLRANYKFGDSEYRHLNRFLFAYFIVKILVFIFIFGAFESDLAVFIGLVGLSISLNGGVAKKTIPSVESQFPENRMRFPLFRKPEGAGAKG